MNISYLLFPHQCIFPIAVLSLRYQLNAYKNMIGIDKNLIVSFAEYYEIIQYDVVIIRVMIFV